MRQKFKRGAMIRNDDWSNDAFFKITRIINSKQYDGIYYEHHSEFDGLRYFALRDHNWNLIE